MPQYDGSIRINTNIEIRNAEKQIADLENSIQEMSKGASDARKNLDEMNKVGVSKNAAEYKDQSAKILEMSKALGELTQKREELLHVMEREWDTSNGDIVDNAKYQEAFSLWEEAKQRTESFRSDIGQYFESISESASNSAHQQTQSVQKTAEDYNILKTDVEEYANALKELEAQGKYFGDEDYDRVYVAWKQATNAVNEYKAALNQKANGSQAEEIEKSAENTKIKISDIVDKFSKVKSAAQNTFSAIVKGFSNVGQAGSKIFSSIKNIAKKAFSSIGNVAKKAFSSITSGSKTSGGALSGFATRVKGIAKTVLVFNLIRQAFNAMVSGVKEGFTNFSNYSSDFANSVQNIKNSVSQIGNQIAAAFAPIIQTVIPWLQRLVDAISTAMSYVAQFIALLTGKSTFTRAKKVQDSYNKSLGGTASAAKKAYGALAKFDDLDVLQKKEDESGGGAGIVDPDSLFEEVPISDKMKDFFNWLKDMWENADFYDLGKLLGEKLKEALENIPWDEIKEVARKLGKSLASLINGFIEVEELGYTIGYTLSQAFNTGFEFLNAFVHELHWDSIGKFIAETLNGIFENIDWELIYDTFVTGARGIATAINSFTDWLDWDVISKTIGNFINTLVDSIHTIISGTDWNAIGFNLGTQIQRSFETINWGNIGRTISDGFIALCNFIISTVDSIDWWSIGSKVATAINGIDWNSVGTAFFNSVATVINAAITSIHAFIAGINWSALGEYFGTTLSNAWASINWSEAGQTVGLAFEAFFDFISNTIESIDWHMVGQSVIDFLTGIDWVGLFESFFEALGAILGGTLAFIDTIALAIGDLIRSGVENAKKYFEDAIEEAGGNIVEGIFNGIVNMMKDAGAWVKEHIFQPIMDGVRNAFQIHSPSKVMEEQGNYVIEGLLNGISDEIDLVSELWNLIKENMIEIWEGIRAWFDEFWVSLNESVVEVWEGIKTFFSDTWTSISETASTVWESIKQFLSETWTTIQTNATTIYTAIKTFLQITWENIKATATTVWNAIKTFLQTTWTNMQNLAVSIWTAIKNWFFEIWQAIKEKALEIWENVRAVFEEKFNAIKEKTQEIISKFNEFRSNVSEVFHNIRDTISETIGSAIGKLSDFISKIREAIEAIKDFLASGFEKVSGFVGGLFGGGGSGRSAAPAARAMAYTMPEIPALASGAVIRGGDPFLAFLGDQPRGQTNIEAPLATIERAVENAMSRNGYGNERVPVNINLQYDGETFARLSLDDILSEANRRGFDVSILGVT